MTEHKAYRNCILYSEGKKAAFILMPMAVGGEMALGIGLFTNLDIELIPCISVLLSLHLQQEVRIGDRHLDIS